MALKLLQSHPRSNGKFGTTGHSRGGTNSFFVSDVKLTSKFLDGTKGFDAIKHATVTKFKNVGSLNIQSRCFSSFLFYAKYYVISPTQKFEI